MPELIHNGATLNWRADGPATGRPVLFLNSLGTDLRLWDSVIPALAGQDLRLVRMDTRGHGASSAPAGPYTLETLVADAQALIDHLDLRDLTLVGVSLGGVMAQALSLANPDRVRAAVLSNTAPRMGQPEAWAQRIAAVEAGGVESIADMILQRWFSPSFAADLAPWRAMLAATPAAGYAGCCGALATADLTARVGGLTQPALVIAGSDDAASPPAQVKALADALPHARYVELPDTGHLPMAERPPLFAALLKDFLLETAP